MCIRDRYKEEYQQMKFQVMDVRKLEFPDNSFEAVIDKGMLDTILCGDKSGENAALMLAEVYRVLTKSGVYICISYADVSRREEYFAMENMNWDVVSDKIPKPVVSKKSAGGKDISKEEGKDFHYVYVLTKKEGESKAEAKPETKQPEIKSEKTRETL
eukprot:TRINITY_DN4572_c0_g1_i3.p2 TRINITY_DN4572_c0_g1~~TRINITY_DN4572_c0_g1_i3.p2  ORF type:complete len:158 (-),score=51.61 TRINITY_DN4572_c0_g1_i3:148-621(-)